MAKENPVIPPPHSGKRRGLKKLFFYSLLLFLIGFAALSWINGPGFRWIAHQYGPRLLQKSGIQGHFSLSGTLLNGPTIKSLEIASPHSPLKHLSARNLRLSYHPFSLRKSLIDSISADSLSLELDFSQPSSSQKKEPDSPASSLEQMIRKYRSIAIHPEVNIDELNLHIHKGDQNYYQLSKAKLTHQARSEAFELRPGLFTDFQNLTSSPETALITWKPEHISLSGVPLAQNASFTEASLKPSLSQLQGVIAIDESQLAFSSDLSSKAALKLTGSPLLLDRFLSLSTVTQDITGRVNTLELQASELDRDFSNWDIDFKVGIESAKANNQAIPRTHFSLIKKSLQMDTSLQVKVTEKAQELNAITHFMPESASNVMEACQNSQTHLSAELTSLGTFLEGLSPLLSLPPLPDGWPDGKGELTASLQLKEGELSQSQAALDFNEIHWAEAQLRQGRLTVHYEDSQTPILAELVIQQASDSTLRSKATFLPTTQHYEASFQAENFLAKSLQPFIRLSLGKIPLAGSITLDWRGSGDLANRDSHHGELLLSQTRLSIDKHTPIQLNLSADYSGLEEINLSSLKIQRDDQILSTSARWDGQRVEIPSLSVTQGPRSLLSGQASLPFSLSEKTTNYFISKESWAVDLQANELDILSTADLLGVLLPKGITGKITTNTLIKGTPSSPEISGELKIQKFSLSQVEALSPIDSHLVWTSVGETFTLDGTILPAGQQPITLSGSSPFLPQKWAENPDSFLDESIHLRVQTSDFQLEPMADFSPQIKTLTGATSFQTQVNGTFRKPEITGSLDVDLKRGVFDIPRFEEIRNTSLKANFAENNITIEPSSLQIDGGIFTLSGDIGILNPAQPQLNLKLNAEKALVLRNSNVNSRCDAELRLKGTLEHSEISGNLDVVESLFYKDIELLPLNIPVSIPSPPALPSLSQKPKTSQNKNTLPVPEPFANWTLNLKAKTADPFLIRGNLTKGQVVGAVTATGTLANPILNGELNIEDLNAALPFSTLKVDGGKISFTPKGGLLPRLDIRAQSRIPPYEVDLFITGSAASPSLSMASNPPLPENEVMTLLATGATTEGLEDPEAAKGKALQLLIEKIRKAPPSSAFHPLARFAEPLKDLEIQVAGVDPFTGKRRNAVTLPLPDSERWFVSTAVDAESNTRGLLLYVLRFR